MIIRMTLHFDDEVRVEAFSLENLTAALEAEAPETLGRNRIGLRRYDPLKDCAGPQMWGSRPTRQIQNS